MTNAGPIEKSIVGLTEGLEPSSTVYETVALPFELYQRMEPTRGFEPLTDCLQNNCSTVELGGQEGFSEKR